jgi:hypothetical protein
MAQGARGNIAPVAKIEQLMAEGERYGATEFVRPAKPEYSGIA